MIDAVRSQPAPASLATEGWNTAELRQRLLQDLHHKCYLCERPIDARMMEVDHRLPQNERPDLSRSWDNLFPACVDCNRRRFRKTPSGGWLSPGEGVEQRLHQRLIPLGASWGTSFEATESDDAAARNCAAELAHLHDNSPLSNPKSYDKGQALVDAAKTEALLAVERYAELRRLRHDPAASPVRIAALQHDLRRRLSRRAPYTMLVRSRFPAAALADLALLLD